MSTLEPLVGVYTIHANFYLVMSLPWERGSNLSKKCGTGGSGGVHLKSTHSMTMSGFSFKKALLGTECFF